MPKWPEPRCRRRDSAPFDCLLGSTEILSSCQPVSRSVTNYRETSPLLPLGAFVEFPETSTDASREHGRTDTPSNRETSLGGSIDSAENRPWKSRVSVSSYRASSTDTFSSFFPLVSVLRVPEPSTQEADEFRTVSTPLVISSIRKRRENRPVSCAKPRYR